MRKLLMLAILISCSGAMARGKITLQNNLHDSGKNYRPSIGFSVYEPFLKGMALNAWMGVGSSPDDDYSSTRWSEDAKWFVAKAQLDFQGDYSLKGFTFSPGIMRKDLIGEDVSDNVGYLTISYQLW